MSNNEQKAEVYGGPIKAAPAIFPYIEHGLQRNPDRPAVVVAHQPQDHLAELTRAHTDGHVSNGASEASYLSWTYSQLHHAALRISGGLVANGVTPGSILMTLIPNSVESHLFLYVSVLLKLTLVPLDYGALSEARSEELKRYLQRIGPDAIVVPNAAGSAAVERALEEAGAKSPTLHVQLESNADESAKWKDLRALHRDGQSQPIDEQKLVEDARVDDGERSALIMFTSGTSSGTPKGCLRPVVSMTQFIQGRRWVDDLSPSSRLLLTTSFFRIIAPTITFSLWYAGGTVVSASALFDPLKALDAIENHHITTIVLIPAMLHALVATPGFEQRDISSVTGIATGGDMITRSILSQMKKAFPSADVVVAHGMTEGGSLFGWPYFHHPIDSIPFFGEIAPVGIVQPGARARIWNHDNSCVAEREQPGELHVCSSGIMRHYLENAHEELFYEDVHGRWFKTGDLAMIDERGLVYILGRIKDVIKRAGVPITPAALESTITKLTGAQTSVFAMPSQTLGQEPFAVLTDFNGHTEQEIKQCILDMFGKDYGLAGAVTLKQLGLQAFPLNATSKIMKIELQKHGEDYLQKH